MSDWYSDTAYCADCGRSLGGLRYGPSARECEDCRSGVTPQEEEAVNINKAFPSKYLKVDDLDGKNVTVTIDHVGVESVGQGDDKEDKPVVYFRGKEKGLVLNKTNALSIIEITGSDETDDWDGHRIVLFPSKTDFAGRRVACIRVEEPPKQQAASKNGRVAPPPPPPSPVVGEETGDFQATDDDVPF